MPDSMSHEELVAYAADWFRACHEAAHAVIGRRLGLTITSASIEPSDADFGRVTFDGKLRPEDDIIYTLAGSIGEIVGSTRPDEYAALIQEAAGRANFSADEKYARDVALLLVAPERVEEYLNLLRQRTLELVTTEWSAIRELAGRLVAQRTVTW